ncbi:MAG: hypothetical protein VX949_11355 [Planctomycetota bacterium]|nr:hypothetical protein [Planctomycetota bacterium]
MGEFFVQTRLLLALAPVLILLIVSPLAPRDLMKSSHASAPDQQHTHPWPHPEGITILLMGEDPPARFPDNLQIAADMGATWIQIAFPTYQRRFDTASFPIADRRAPSNEKISGAILSAKALGFKVAIHPLLLIQDPTDPHWRGQLDPQNLARWFRYYRQWIGNIAALSERAGADLLFVGSELSSLQSHTMQWQHTVDEVRKIFSGWISYSANWDDWQQIAFARHLDALGINGYIPLSDGSEIHREALIARWLPVRGQIHGWTRLSGIPIFFSELGYPSHTHGLERPWDHVSDYGVDLAMQTRGYQAFIDTFSSDPVVAGTFFYALHEDGGEHDRSYTPAGKPAQTLIHDFFQRGSQVDR